MTKNITILCKVIDNFGDIGFVHRLARKLLDFTDFNLRLVVSNLKTYSLLYSEINPELDKQQINNCTIYNWNSNDICAKDFTTNFPELIFECFQCGRPDWLESILFPSNNSSTNPICQIINIDYLTAEDYAETFHCLKSLTRSSRVKKVNFMPGFKKTTGGLILDEPFISAAKKNLLTNNLQYDNFKMLCFSYEKNFNTILKAINNFSFDKFYPQQKSFLIDIANGRGKESFLTSYSSFIKQNSNIYFDIHELSFLSQTNWDINLFNYNFLIIRGEDSLSRAVLSGIPFVWHAYKQDDDYQLVKVKALLKLMQPFFNQNTDEKNLFSVLNDFWIDFNTSLQPVSEEKILENFYFLLNNSQKLSNCFKKFAQNIINNGDFVDHLLAFTNSLSCI